MIAIALPLVLIGRSACATGRELIRDPRFARGFEVQDPTPGKRVVVGKLQWEDCDGEPVWSLAQWSSRYSIHDAVAEGLPSGAVRFANEAKTITIGPPGSEEGDLSLAADARLEYPDGPRKLGQDWPHLLVGQQLESSPSVAEMQSLAFRLEARLNRCENHTGQGYFASLHAAQFITTITVQNLNRKSPGYGDFLWLNLVQYDDRQPIPQPFIAPDQAHQKLIFAASGERLATRSLHDGEWVTFAADLLPIVRDALQAAWDREFLTDSRNLADYRLGGISIGWELPGTFAAEVQVRNLSLIALVP
ncbi:MAG: hypothetical protein FJX74_08205 [Armatimonadetes bacterium]|nr:hypothetical protein [Armatimonadota bacterium]